MTGEVTLTGLVQLMGGIKEKVLAARRAGIRRIVLRKANRKDLRGLPENVREEMEFARVERVQQVIRRGCGKGLAAVEDPDAMLLGQRPRTEDCAR